MTHACPRFDSYESIRNDAGRNDRFNYAKVTLRGDMLFAKQSLFPAGSEHLRRELVWYDFIRFVVDRYPKLDIRPLKNVTIESDDVLTSEWLDAPLVSLPHDSAGWVRNLDRYTDMLVAFDVAAESYDVPSDLRTYEPRDAYERLSVWLNDVIENDLIIRARERFKQSADGLHKVMQHGDLTPWQIMDDDGTWVVIDGEKSGDDLFRFNDVAYSYGRLATRCDDEAAADELLAGFIKKRRLPDQIVRTQLIPVIIYRLLGMLGDAAEDQNDKEYQAVERILQKVLDS